MGGLGGSSLPPPVPCTPGSFPFFLGFNPLDLFYFEISRPCCVISPYSPASHPFSSLTSRSFLSPLPYPLYPNLPSPSSCPPPHRELKILRRGQLRERDFLNTEYFSREKQRHFGGKK